MLCALLFCQPALAQTKAPPPDVNLFGDELVTRKPTTRVARNNGVIVNDGPQVARAMLFGIFGGRAKAAKAAEPPKPKGVEGLGQSVIFQNGRQMRGELVELVGDELVWRRPDISEPVRLGRDELKRLVLGTTQNESSDYDGAVIEGFIQPQTKTTATTTARKATVKLPGSDWLFGEVSSADGSTFDVKLDAKTSFSIPRAAVEWLYFDAKPVGAITLDGTNYDGWNVTGETPKDAKDGRMVFKTGHVGHALKPPPRFEVAFETPVEPPKGSGATQLWLQPFSPSPNSYSTGTITFEFGEKALGRCIYLAGGDGIKHVNSDLPAEKPEDGWHKWSVIHDSVEKKVTVSRNGKEVGSWPITKKGEDEPGGSPRALRSLCFSGEPGRGFSVGNIRVQPWDGGAAGEGDRLTADGKSESGKLESLKDGTLKFSGADKTAKTGTMLRLNPPRAGLANAGASVALGTNGRFAVDALEVREGRAKFRTSFAETNETDAAQLVTVEFPPRKTDDAAGDVLVFKNGDEFPGSLVSGGSDRDLVWKTPRGTEVKIAQTFAAGIRLAEPPTAEKKPAVEVIEKTNPPKADELKPADKTMTVALRNGDRVFAEFATARKDALVFKHAVFGEAVFSREALWSIHPGRDLMERNRATEWLRGSARGGWTMLDGSFLSRRTAQNSRNDSESAYIGRSSLRLPARFELRAEATSIGGDEPYFSVSMNGKNSQMTFSFSHGDMSINAYATNRAGRSIFEQVPFAGKIPEDSNRRQVRFFVDREKGSVDVYLDGVLLKRMGQRKEGAFPGVGENITFGCQSGYQTVVLSGIWLGPWNGEPPPREGEHTASVAFINGDASAGTVLDLRDGKVLLDSEAGELELPLERITGIEFGGAPAPAKAAARLRMKDGSIVHLDSFTVEAGQVVGKSGIFGEVKVATETLDEIVLNPSAAKFPRLAVKTEKKTEEKPTEEKPKAAPAEALPE